MEIGTIDDLFSKFSIALEWALKLTGRSKDSNRFVEYERVIKRQMDDYLSGNRIKNVKISVLKEHSEAYLEAHALIGIHEKFKNNENKYFKEKLNNIFDGEYYASDEPVGTHSFARDTQAELVFASKCLNPEKLTFWGNDIVYNFENFKFGIEVKRINSDKVINSFELGCDQIQEKRIDVNYGIVTLSMDRFLYFNDRNGILFLKPTLLPRGNFVIKAEDAQELFAMNKLQLQLFHNEYELQMREISRRYPKVAGFCILIYHPTFVGDPVGLVASGYAEYVLWDSKERPDRKLAFDRFMKEQFFEHGSLSRLF